MAEKSTTPSTTKSKVGSHGALRRIPHDQLREKYVYMQTVRPSVRYRTERFDVHDLAEKQGAQARHAGDDPGKENQGPGRVY
jgi:hypothetical protein